MELELTNNLAGKEIAKIDERRFQSPLVPPLIEAIQTKASVSQEAGEELAGKLMREAHASEKALRELGVSNDGMCGLKVAVSFEYRSQNLAGRTQSIRVRFCVEKELNRWIVYRIEPITGEEPNHWIEVPVAANLEIIFSRYHQPEPDLA